MRFAALLGGKNSRTSVQAGGGNVKEISQLVRNAAAGSRRLTSARTILSQKTLFKGGMARQIPTLPGKWDSLTLRYDHRKDNPIYCSCDRKRKIRGVDDSWPRGQKPEDKTRLAVDSQRNQAVWDW